MRLRIVAVLCGVPDVGLEPVVSDVAGGQQEKMLAHIHRMARLDRQRDHLARRVAREGDVARALRLGHDQRHAGEHALPAALERHGGDVDLRDLSTAARDG